MNFGISFAPLVPETIVWVVLAIACVLAAMLVFAKARGLWMRIVAMTLFVLALANPSITREDRDPLTSVAVVVIDKSPSQEFGDRPRQPEAVRGGEAQRPGARIPVPARGSPKQCGPRSLSGSGRSRASRCASWKPAKPMA